MANDNVYDNADVFDKDCGLRYAQFCLRSLLPLLQGEKSWPWTITRSPTSRKDEDAHPIGAEGKQHFIDLSQAR